MSYRVNADITPHLANEAGLAVRVQGLRRYYAALLTRRGLLRIVKVRDGVETLLAETPFDWSFDTAYQFSIDVAGRHIRCSIGKTALNAQDDDRDFFDDGALALVVSGGALSSNEICVRPIRLSS
jgi:hypothetical protein